MSLSSRDILIGKEGSLVQPRRGGQMRGNYILFSKGTMGWGTLEEKMEQEDLVIKDKMDVQVAVEA